jgi:acetyl-CoA acetyltransferase
MSSLKDKAAIVGIAQSRFAKHLEDSEKELACQVIVEALADAGIDPGEVDGLCSYTMEDTDHAEVAKNVGTGDIRFFSQQPWGGGAGCATVGHGAMAVALGLADVVVAWRSRKRGSSPRMWSQLLAAHPSPAQWSWPSGVIRPVDEIAILASRYMHEFGVTRDQLANVALAFRRHANLNPNAMMHERVLTKDDYMSSRWIAEPLCLYDNCLETDGALACVVVSAARAKHCRQKPVYIHATAQGLARQQHAMLNFWAPDPFRGPSWVCGPNLWRAADFGPQDVDVAQIYDAFSPLVLFSLEGYGFCGRGEAGAFVEDGGIEVGGRLPVNTSGGSLSEAYVHGFNLINEGVRQLRGTSTAQVGGAETCLVTSAEAVPSSALLLRA